MTLEERIRRQLDGYSDVVEKQIVGGTGFMWRGNLLCSVLSGDLLVRIAKQDQPAYLLQPGASAMTMGGRSSKSWVVVQAAAVDSDSALAIWIQRAADFVGSLPAK